MDSAGLQGVRGGKDVQSLTRKIVFYGSPKDATWPKGSETRTTDVHRVHTVSKSRICTGPDQKMGLRSVGSVSPASWLPLTVGREFLQPRARLLVEPCIVIEVESLHNLICKNIRLEASRRYCNLAHIFSCLYNQNFKWQKLSKAYTCLNQKVARISSQLQVIL